LHKLNDKQNGNSLQKYNKYLEYTRIWAIKCKFIYILVEKCLLFAQLCDWTFGGFLVRLRIRACRKYNIPKIQVIWAIYLEFADVSERNFEVGRLSRVGALENTKKV